MFYNPYTGGPSGQYNVPNPAVPYEGEIPGGFLPGQRCVIRGYVPGHSERFQFDFMTYNGCVAFHVNPRFDQNQVVRNTDDHGWGEEELYGDFPFRHSEPFELVVQATDYNYIVEVNGYHVFDYNHRIPVHEVNRLGVSGDVEVHSITFQGGSQSRTNEVYNPSVPGAVYLEGGCQPGKLIQIAGSVPYNAGRFEVNLQGGPGEQPDNMALHFNPRWDDPNQPDPVVVRTHRHYGSWGSEDRDHPHFPFMQGANFELLILNDNDEWKVAVNGQHFIAYPQHFECGLVDHVAFGGDVQIHSVRQFN